LFAIKHFVLFSIRQHVQVCWLCWKGYLKFLKTFMS
jgi:hypothetical protein